MSEGMMMVGEGLQHSVGRSRDHISVILKIALIFLVSIVITSLLMIPWMQAETERRGQQAIQALETFIQGTARQLSPLIQVNGPECSGESVTRLRRHLFGFSRVKEIGLYNTSYHIYCVSNDGPVSFRLPASLRQRIGEAGNGQTLSLTRAKIADTQALFIYVRDADSEMGANVLMAPSAFDDLVRAELDETALPFRIEVIGRATQLDPRSSYLEHWATRELNVVSGLYPLTISLYQTGAYQLSFLLRYLWVGLLLGSTAALLYLYISHSRLRNNGLAADLQRAIEERELYVCYQPIIDYQQGVAVGFEALLRWQHPQQGAISPTVFIPLAEQLNLIVPVTNLVLDDVERFIRKYPGQLGNRYISVNISRQHILRHDLAEMIKLRCHELPALNRHLMLELTEDSAFAEDEMAQVLDQLERIQSCGVRLAVDDFGTGYSGLDFIRRYSFDVLKIDRTFVTGLGKEAVALPLLESMIGLAHQLGMSVIAEGVEHPHQAELLSELGVHKMQGFLFALPVPEQHLLEWLEGEKARRGVPFETERASEIVPGTS